VSDVELAWAAGFLDGEGCIRAKKTGSQPYLSITMPQVDPRPLQRFARVVGGRINGPYDRKGGNNPNARPCYELVAYSREAWPILSALWPFLSEPKREQAKRTIRKLYTDRRAWVANGGIPRSPLYVGRRAPLIRPRESTP
jgi:hypothetical protein